MIFVCKLPINKIKGYLFSLLSLSGASSGSPYQFRQIMVLIKTVSKTTCPLFYIYHVSIYFNRIGGPWWSWSYGSWIYNYLCNRQTKVVISNHVHGKVYSIQHYVIKFVSDLRQVHSFPLILWFPPPIKLTATV
jgi:hypothetical protein